ncbi:unnamed protein product [Closterium sp. Yama58-4]|nr:unnamed protein product [Closterium sp. Yama58-4]
MAAQVLDADEYPDQYPEEYAREYPEEYAQEYPHDYLDANDFASDYLSQRGSARRASVPSPSAAGYQAAGLSTSPLRSSMGAALGAGMSAGHVRSDAIGDSEADRGRHERGDPRRGGEAKQVRKFSSLPNYAGGTDGAAHSPQEVMSPRRVPKPARTAMLSGMGMGGAPTGSYQASSRGEAEVLRGVLALLEAVRDDDVARVNRILQDAPSRTALLHCAHPGTGRAALHEAVVAGSVDAAAALLEWGADPDGGHASQIFPPLLPCPVLAYPVCVTPPLLPLGRGQMPPILLAVQAGSEKAVTLLLSHGADINAHDAQLCTALHYACADAHRYASSTFPPASPSHPIAPILPHLPFPSPSLMLRVVICAMCFLFAPCAGCAMCVGCACVLDVPRVFGWMCHVCWMCHCLPCSVCLLSPYSPTYRCTTRGRGMIKLLLVAGANMYARNSDGLLPQQLASTDRIRALFSKLHDYHHRHGLLPPHAHLASSAAPAAAMGASPPASPGGMERRSPHEGGLLGDDSWDDQVKFAVPEGGERDRDRDRDRGRADGGRGSSGLDEGGASEGRGKGKEGSERSERGARKERSDRKCQSFVPPSSGGAGRKGGGGGAASVSEEDLKLIRADWRADAARNGCVACGQVQCECKTRPENRGAAAKTGTGDDVKAGGSKEGKEKGGGKEQEKQEKAGQKEAGGRGVEEEEEDEAVPEELLQDDPEVSPLGTMKWKRGELLGEGAYGKVRCWAKVFLGLNERTGELMAVKQMKINAGDERAMHIAALEREIVLYRRMRHRHIVGYIDMEKDPSDGSIYIFLEFVSGGSIHSMLEKFGKFSESLVRVYTRQLLLGLEYLHRCKIIHRDIKGGNVLVDRDGVIKLADFGASKAFQEGTVGEGCKSIRGSVFWMAPEVITGAGYGRKADIWSLGCTVIEMLTGSHPWPGMDNTWSAIFHIAKTTTGPPTPEESSPEGRDFLAACFQLDPALRPSAAQLLQHPFVQVPDTPRDARMAGFG